MRKYVVYGQVPSKSNLYAPRKDGKGFYKKKKVKEYEKIMRMQIQNVLRVNGEFYFIAKVFYKSTRTDLLNFPKVFADVLQSEGKIENDRYVIKTVQSRFKDKENPRVEFWLLPSDEYEIEVRIKRKSKQNIN